jgi:hypothetical protein
MTAIKTHFFRVIERPNGSRLTTTACGRMSNQCADGINSTDDRAKVTCKFCLRALSTNEGGR